MSLLRSARRKGIKCIRYPKFMTLIMAYLMSLIAAYKYRFYGTELRLGHGIMLPFTIG